MPQKQGRRRVAGAARISIRWRVHLRASLIQLKVIGECEKVASLALHWASPGPQPPIKLTSCCHDASFGSRQQLSVNLFKIPTGPTLHFATKIFDTRRKAVIEPT